MGRVTSDWESGVPCMDCIRVFWTFNAAEDAARGGADMGSVGESWSKLDAMTLLGRPAMLASAVSLGRKGGSMVGQQQEVGLVVVVSMAGEVVRRDEVSPFEAVRSLPWHRLAHKRYWQCAG